MNEQKIPIAAVRAAPPRGALRLEVPPGCRDWQDVEPGTLVGEARVPVRLKYNGSRGTFSFSFEDDYGLAAVFRNTSDDEHVGELRFCVGVVAEVTLAGEAPNKPIFAIDPEPLFDAVREAVLAADPRKLSEAAQKPENASDGSPGRESGETAESAQTAGSGPERAESGERRLVRVQLSREQALLVRDCVEVEATDDSGFSDRQVELLRGSLDAIDDALDDEEREPGR